MKRSKWMRWFGSALLVCPLVLSPLVLGGCKVQCTAEDEPLEEMGENIEEGVEETGDEIEEATDEN